VKALVDAEDWPALHAADQLSASIQNGLALQGFREGVSNFNPTFKMERADGFNYTVGNSTLRSSVSLEHPFVAVNAAPTCAIILRSNFVEIAAWFC
jgi:hypothetical protein